MRRIHPALSAPELGHLAEEIHHLLAELERAAGPGAQAAGECQPPLDVFETAEALEVRLEVPGVPAKGLRVIFKEGLLVVAGTKIPPSGTTPSGATFHLAERDFGRFVRAVRLEAVLDPAAARAVLGRGELRIVVPKRAERRGRDIQIPIDVLPPGAEASS